MPRGRRECKHKVNWRKKEIWPAFLLCFGTMVEVLPNSWPGEGQKQPLFAAVRCWSRCAALQPQERGEPCYLHELWPAFPCLGRDASWLASPVRVWKSRGFPNTHADTEPARF